MVMQTPRLKQLITENYEINQIQHYTTIMKDEINNFINSVSKQKCVVNLITNLTLTSVSSYVLFNSVGFDPFQTYNATTGVFTSPVTGVVEISCNIIATGPAGSNMQVVGQINKSAISGSPITNYDFNLSYIGNVATANLNGVQLINLNKGDQVRIVFVSTNVPVTISSIPNNSQITFQW